MSVSSVFACVSPIMFRFTRKKNDFKSVLYERVIEYSVVFINNLQYTLFFLSVLCMYHVIEEVIGKYFALFVIVL